MRKCSHILNIQKFMERSIENTRSELITTSDLVSKKIINTKTNYKLRGKYKREQIAHLAKYNHMC